MLGIRNRIQREIHGLVGFGTGAVDLDAPRGDPGLFGPRSVTWRVHADFTGMMIGGISSLLLQMLHPGALAGVWDHSDFQRNMAGRLQRTAQFVSGTTYGATGPALALIERVRRIHRHVHGTLPDGTPYQADDPDLLTWVHVAEVGCFLEAYKRYRDPRMPIIEQDRYFRENATIAERLGATDVPRDAEAVAAYFEAMRPRLVFDERTREVSAALLGAPAPNALLVPFREVAMQAGVDLLPAWAAAMHGIALTERRRHAIRASVNGVGTVARWAMQDNSARRARRRMGGGALSA